MNRHGVFLKKRILHELQKLPGISVVSEEFVVSFGETRVIDVLARDQRASPHVYFIFKCKRAYATDRRWIFFRDFDQRYRKLRVQSGFAGNDSVFANVDPINLPVCSEGYEFRKSDGKANQDPVFQAAAQLSASYLGLITRREKDFHPHPSVSADVVEGYVPILVTTAELVVIQKELGDTCLQTGKFPTKPFGKCVDAVILKQPFPSPSGIRHDFRNEMRPKDLTHWSQFYKESIYVIRASALGAFLAESQLDHLRSVITK